MLERDFLDNSIDWRQHISPEQRWLWHVVPGYMTSAIVNYMQALKLDFGRFDFLLDEQQRYWFCEVNPNGQFAWLDLEGEYGLTDAVTQEILPKGECHPIPNRHPLEGSYLLRSTPRLGSPHTTGIAVVQRMERQSSCTIIQQS